MDSGLSACGRVQSSASFRGAGAKRRRAPISYSLTCGYGFRALGLRPSSVKRVIPGRRSEAEASPESILPDLWSWIPGSRPAAEPRNDWTKVLPARTEIYYGFET